MDIRTILLLLPLLFAACSDGNDPVPAAPVDPGFQEPVPEKIVCTQANVVYAGDDMGAEVSDSWLVTLYTDMEVDEAGNLIGPGRMFRISLNAPFAEEQTPDLDLLKGTYREAASTGDFSPGTFNPGFMTRIDLPTGTIERPDGSFYGDIPAATTDFEADLLREGYCSFERDGDLFRIEGMLVGERFLKRYFSYTGPVKVIDRTDPAIPNTTLTQDVVLEGLVQSRLRDRGDSFFLGDESYRRFELLLAGEGVDLTKTWPAGDGEVLRIEFFVPWTADVAEGVPEGTYTVTELAGGSGIDRENIVPFHIMPGIPDQFTYTSGTWYELLADGVMTEYGRIAGGRMKVDRTDGRHRIEAEFTDCADPAHRVRCVWESAGPIPVTD